MNKYRELLPINESELIKSLTLGDDSSAAEAILRMSVNTPDWEWAERICLQAIDSNRADVKMAAVTALGHLARRFGTLHLNLVLPVLHRLAREPAFRGVADDALDDIAIFIKAE